MNKNMIEVVQNEPRAGTHLLSIGFEVEHRALRKLVLKYKTEFETFGVITSAMQKPTSKNGGRPIDEFLLNEEQTMYLGTLLTNNEKVRMFKMKLVKEFSKIRKTLAMLLIDKKNQEYIESRKKGIEVRKEETDTIKEFVDYAISQGSESAKMYYANISKMQNAALFVLEQKFSNLREQLNFRQLNIVSVADQIICRWLKDGMERKLHYKDIYKLAKEKVLAFADNVGRSVVPLPDVKLIAG